MTEGDVDKIIEESERLMAFNADVVGELARHAKELHTSLNRQDKIIRMQYVNSQKGLFHE
jgi:hypothetical protein